MLKLQSSSRQLYRKFSVSKPFGDKEQFIRCPSQVNVNLATIGDTGLSSLQIQSTFFILYNCLDLRSVTMKWNLKTIVLYNGGQNSNESVVGI